MKKLLLALASALLFSTSAWAAVDLNKASQAELETLNGVGPKKAQAIIEYRKKNGDFKSVDDLDKVPGFGKKSVSALKKDQNLTVGNATAAAAGKVSDSKSIKEAKEKMRTVGNEKAAESGNVSESKMVKDAAQAKEKANEVKAKATESKDRSKK